MTQGGLPQSVRGTLFTAAVCLATGASVPYFPVWLEDIRGFSGSEIGLVLGIATLLRMITGPILGGWSEKGGFRQCCAAVSMLAAMAFLLLSQWESHLAVLLLSVITYNLIGIVMPLSDAILMQTSKGVAILNYGVARAIGSSAFIFANLVLGAMMTRFGPESVIWWLFGVSALMLLTAMMLPGADQTPQNRITFFQSLRAGAVAYRSGTYAFMMLATIFLQASHTYYYNFGSIIWLRQGYAEWIGSLWAMGVVVEVIILIFSARLFAKWTPYQIAALAVIGGLVRWGLMGAGASGVLLVMTQCLHSMTFAATLLATIRFISDTLDEARLPMAVSFNAALAFGPAMAMGGIVSGWLFEWLDGRSGASVEQGYWLMAGFCAFASLMLFTSWRFSRAALVDSPAERQRNA